MSPLEEEKEKRNKANELVDEVNSTIKSVCVKIREDNMAPGMYPDTVKALAALVEARANLISC